MSRRLPAHCAAALVLVVVLAGATTACADPPGVAAPVHASPDLSSSTAAIAGPQAPVAPAPPAVPATAPVADDCRRFTDLVAAVVLHASGFGAPPVDDAGLVLPPDVQAALDEWATTVMSAKPGGGDPDGRLRDGTAAVGEPPAIIDRHAAQLCGTG